MIIPPPNIFRNPDAASVQGLLARSGLPGSDLTPAHMEHFLGAGSSSELVGVVGLEVLGETGLLRSLAVQDEWRGTGLGKALVRAIEAEARSVGVQDLFLLTTTAAPFFASVGYGAVPRADAPLGLQATPEFASLCPSTATCMHKPMQA